MAPFPNEKANGVAGAVAVDAGAIVAGATTGEKAEAGNPALPNPLVVGTGVG